MLPRAIEVEKTETGVLLRDPTTGHELIVEPNRVLEIIVPKERCHPRSFRILDVPSKKVPGKKVRMVMCCLKQGRWNEQANRCQRGYFVPAAIVHPTELANQLIREFLTGELARRRERHE